MSALVPSADQVARALTIACNWFGDNPLAIAAGCEPKSFTALHAIEALSRFCVGRSGAMNFEQLCRLCGVPAATSEDLAAAKQHDRWSLSLVLAIADRLERDAARA